MVARLDKKNAEATLLSQYLGLMRVWGPEAVVHFALLVIQPFNLPCSGISKSTTVCYISRGQHTLSMCLCLDTFQWEHLTQQKCFKAKNETQTIASDSVCHQFPKTCLKYIKHILCFGKGYVQVLFSAVLVLISSGDVHAL